MMSTSRAFLVAEPCLWDPSPQSKVLPARNQNAITHLVTVVAFDGVVLGDVSTPCEIFALARGRDGQPLYDVRICSLAPEVKSEHVRGTDA